MMVKIGKLGFLDAVAIVGFYVLLSIATFTDCLATDAKIDFANPVRVNELDISLPAWVNSPRDASSD